jgi:surfactin synthase thioesterase subunit
LSQPGRQDKLDQEFQTKQKELADKLAKEQKIGPAVPDRARHN